MRWRGVGAMGDVGRGGWGVGVAPGPAVASEHSALELSRAAKRRRLERIAMRHLLIP
jgi:hypothetical protein